MLVKTEQLSLLSEQDLEHICAALRRDMHAEEERALSDKTWADVHRQYAYHDKQLLQFLNPKHGQAEYDARKQEERRGRELLQARQSSQLKIKAAA